MSLVKWSKKEMPIPGFKKPKSLLYSATSLASVESLSLPLVQEIVVLADMSCAGCQKRVTDIMSRMNETESVLVDVLEKKVTLTCRYPAVKVPPSGKVAGGVYRKPLLKIAMIKQIFLASCSKIAPCKFCFCPRSIRS